MNKIVISITIIGLLASMLSCKKNKEDEPKDNTKPVITIYSPSEEQVISAGSDTSIICLNANFTDDMQLKEFKINIHPAAGHNHKSIQSWDTTLLAKDHPELQLSGLNRDIDFDILLNHFQIADTGEYHYMVYCLDAAGNEALAYRTIRIIMP